MTQKSNAIPLKTWLVLIAAGILVLLMNIDYTAVNLTLVPISLELNEDLNNLQWLLSGYVLIWAAFVIPAGRMADIYGKRNTLIGGLLLFMLGSCLTGLGQNLETLILGRVIQGFGAAIFTAPCWALIFTSAPPEKQGFVMGIILSFSGVGLAIGPTLGGYIIETLVWRWIYYINIPIGIVVIIILMLFSKNDRIENSQKIDYIGALLLASGLCLSVFGLNQIETWGIHDVRLWVVMGAGVGIVLGFYLHDRKQSFRMIPNDLMKNKPFLAATFGEFFMAMNFSLILVLMGLYLQNTQGYSSYETGLVFFAMTISMGLLSPFGGKMVDHFGLKLPMLFGCIATGIATFLFSGLGVGSSLYFILVALFLVGAGMGAYFTACSTAMMRAVPQEDLNVASGVFTMWMMVGNTLSIILSTSLVVLFGRASLFERLETHKVLLTPLQKDELAEVIAKVEHTPDQLAAFPQDQIPVFLEWITEAFVHGFSINMMLGTLWAILATGLTLWGIKGLDQSSGKVAAPLGH
ncbi:MFS transporter [Candidatus Bealeia paramacronuclearis]|uniref:MFS transporter n=1 Tax=Candidatus Bealeia paramacronuclearis TaxID=1921001 RepID=A0ABZ2C2J6_9PROT|nr:MFS transporter [Candidatus Bealeia paramacronuclearis]